MSKPPSHIPKASPSKQSTPTKNALSKNSDSNKSKLWFYAIALCIITFVAYFGAFDHTFVDWDDYTYVVDNPLITHPTFDGLVKLCRASVSLNYHPLTMISMWLNSWFFGKEATSFIVVNVLLHLLNTVLVFYFLYLLGKRQYIVPAAVAALWFGIHPMHVESVAWVSERKDVLYAFFFLLSTIAYMYHIDQEPQNGKNAPSKWYWYALALFVLSCLSKAMAVVLPLVFILIDFWRQRNLSLQKSVIEKLPFFAIALLFGVLALGVQGGNLGFGLLEAASEKKAAISDLDLFSPFQRLQFGAYGFTMYLVKLFLPLNLCTFYPYPTVAESTQLRFLLAPLVFLAALGSAFFLRKRFPLYTFAIGFFFVTLILVLQFLSVGSVIMADRYTYLPYIGLFFLLCHGSYVWLQQNKASLLPTWYAVVGAMSLFFFVQTIRQVETWQDSDTLWNHVIAIYPNEEQPYSIRGNHHGKMGKIDLAIQDFERALKLGSTRVSVYEGLGNAYGTKGNLEKAIENFNKAIELDPNTGTLYFNRGISHLYASRGAEAVKDFDRALELMPYKATQIKASRGYGKLMAGDIKGSIADYDAALSQPDGATHTNFFNRGQAHLQDGNKQAAAADFRKALQLKPDFAEAQQKLQLVQ